MAQSLRSRGRLLVRGIVGLRRWWEDWAPWEGGRGEETGARRCPPGLGLPAQLATLLLGCSALSIFARSLLSLSTVS